MPNYDLSAMTPEEKAGSLAAFWAKKEEAHQKSLALMNRIVKHAEFIEVIAWFPYRTALIGYSFDADEQVFELDRDEADDLEMLCAKLSGHSTDNHTACIVRMGWSGDMYAIAFSDLHTRIANPSHLRIGNY